MDDEQNQAGCAMPPTPETSSAGPAAISVSHLSHFFKQHRALDDVGFDVAPQCIHGFVGPNGAGKTTTLRVIATLLKPQHGHARIYGHDVKDEYREVRRLIGFMPDHFSMYRQMTVFEYLDFFAAAYGMNLKERNQTIGDVLALTDMDGRRNDLIKGLSRGMQQRVSLSRVLVHDPKLLLLDEPASGLDPRARIELMEILVELKNLGKTIFISSHILSELAELCDSCTILDRGQVKYTGSMEGLLGAHSEDRRYRLRLEEKNEMVGANLAKLSALHLCESLPDEPGYLVAFDSDKLGVNEVLRSVMDAGGVIKAFQPEARHLNQAFMDLTEAGVRT